MSISTRSVPTSRLVLGPLTTTYTAPEICSIYAYAGTYAFQAQGCRQGAPADTSSCWPSASVTAPSPPYWGWGFYSPGLACPNGYTSACTAAALADGSPSPITSGTSFKFQFPLLPGETAVGCCPRYKSGYYVDGHMLTSRHEAV